MTHKERFLAALDKEECDRLPFGDTLWGETVRRYVKEGYMKEGEDLVEHFNMSWRTAGWINSVADLDFKEVIIEETEETKLVLNGNRAKLRWWKHKSGTPEHVDFEVKDRESWERLIKPFLLYVDKRRIDFNNYRLQKEKAAKENRAFCWGGLGPFEQIHPVCGHECMLMAMCLDPDWIKDMVMTYVNFTIIHMEALFQEEGLPDAFWVYEDMGFKGKPFMSPEMYKELIQPGHKILFDYIHSLGRRIIVHSCGFVEPLVPGLIEAGMDCLQAMEVKAGMDMPRLVSLFGNKISFCGNIDIRIIASNDRDKIREELVRKIVPVLKSGSGYIVHSDHSIPPQVDRDTLVFFFEEGSRIPELIKENKI